MFEIEKFVPIPADPFAEMEIGDSIFFAESAMKAASSYSHAFGVRHGMKFTTRLVDGGMRIWRVS